MSAVICGKRSLFEDIHGSPPIAKRLRCGGGSSPIRFSSGALWRSGSSGSPQHTSADPTDQLSQLRALFSDMDEQLVEKVLESSGNSLDSAILSLNELRLSSNGRGSSGDSIGDSSSRSQTSFLTEDGSTCTLSGDVARTEGAASAVESGEWVKLFMQEMLSASNLDDARDRAARALEAFEKTLMDHTGFMFKVLQKENATLKEQLQGFLRDNHILKRAVAIQHERQVEHEHCSQEMQQLKQLITQYEEQIRTLELNNYALNLHLRKAQEGSSMPGRFHPDVF